MLKLYLPSDYSISPNGHYNLKVETSKVCEFYIHWKM